jgi:hypothetical protein
MKTSFLSSSSLSLLSSSYFPSVLPEVELVSSSYSSFPYGELKSPSLRDFSSRSSLNSSNFTFLPLFSSEYHALQELYDSCNGKQWKWLTSTVSTPVVGAVWKFSVSVSSLSHPCEENWQGITCSCYYTTDNSLVDSSLYSSSPSSVLRLKQKKESNRGKYHLSNEAASASSYYYYSPSEEEDGSSSSSSGPRPEIYCTVTGLSLINMNLIGTIPSSFSSLKNVTALHLNHNSLRNTNVLTLITSTMKKLEVLSLSNNQFGGSLPNEINRLTALTFLNLEKNSFVGSLPTELLELVTLKLRVLQLGNNKFNGKFPDFPGGMIASLSSFSPLSSFDRTSSASLATTQPNCPLEWFIINNNQFRGPFPSSVDTFLSLLCNNLTVFNIGFNAFSGSQAPLVSLLNGNSANTQLEVYQINSNQFSGLIIPTALDYNGDTRTTVTLSTINRQLKYLFLQNNRFTGSIPIAFYYYPSLLQLYLNSNQLSSSLVNEHFCQGNWKNLLILSVNNNRLTGELTDICLAKLTQLREIKLSTNNFLSSFPSSLLNGIMPNIQKIFLMNNHFFGSLPAIIAYSKLKKLDTFYLSNNQLTGTLPLTLWNITTLSTIAIQENSFSGPVITGISSARSSIRWKKSSLSIIDLTSNKFTGLLPDELFFLPKLTNLFIVRNCLNQELPNSLIVCSSNKLFQRLSLDGMTSNCQSTANSGNGQFFQELANYECLFSDFHRLSLLHLSSLSFKGTLPTNVTSSLVDLAISQNYLTGSIPMSYQQDKFWLKLDLSYNKLSGKLYDGSQSLISSGPSMTLGFNRNMSLLLQANRLSGIVPSSYASLKNINVLSGNFFTCSYDQTDLPIYDPTTPLYSCGTNRLNIMLFIWVGYLFLSILWLTWFSCKRQQPVDVENVPVCGRGQFTGKLIENFRRFFRFEYSEIIVQLSSITNLFLQGITCLRISVVLTLCYFGFFFVFIYSILSSFFRSYYVTYAFLLSSGFLSGLFPAIFLLLLWSFYMICTYYGIVYYFKKWILLEIEEILLMNQQQQQSQQQQQQPVIAETSVEADRELEQGRHSDNASLSPKKSGAATVVSAATTHTNKKQQPFLWKWNSLSFLFFLFLLFVAVGSLIIGLIFVNIGFLYSQSHFSSTYSSLCQIALAFFKIYFTRYITPTFLFIPFWILEHKVSTSSAMEAYFDSLHSSDYAKKKIRNEKIKFFRIRIELLLSIFLVILTPIIATMIFEINCYRGIFFPDSSVTSNYSHEVCLVEAVNPLTSSIACLTKGVVVYISSFQPSFRYNYQCSTSLILSYVNVFVMMVIVETFVKPTGRESLSWIAEKIRKIREKGEVAAVGQLETTAAIRSGGKKVVPIVSTVVEEGGENEEDMEAAGEREEQKRDHSIWKTGYKVVPIASVSLATSEEEQKNDASSDDDQKKEKTATAATSQQLTLSTSLQENNQHEVKRNRVKKPLLPFDDSSQLIFFINFLSVLFTFGCMFPPLAIMICFLLFVRCYEIEKGILVYYETLTEQLDTIMIEMERIEKELLEEESWKEKERKRSWNEEETEEEGRPRIKDERLKNRNEKRNDSSSAKNRLETERRELQQYVNEDQEKEEIEAFHYDDASEIDNQENKKENNDASVKDQKSLSREQQLLVQKEEFSFAKRKIYLIIHLNERKLQKFYFLLIDHMFCYLFPLHIVFIAYFFFDILGDALNRWDLALIPSSIFVFFFLFVNFLVYYYYCQRRSDERSGKMGGFGTKTEWFSGGGGATGPSGRVKMVQVSPRGDNRNNEREDDIGRRRADDSHVSVVSDDKEQVIKAPFTVEKEKESRAFSFASPVTSRSKVKDGKKKKDQSTKDDQLPVSPSTATASSQEQQSQQSLNPHFHRIGMTELELAATNTVNVFLVQLQNEEMLEMLENQDEMIDLGNDIVDTFINYFTS